MPELKKTKNSFSELSDEEAEKVTARFNLAAAALLPTPNFVNTYSSLFESMNVAANLVQMNHKAILEATSAFNRFLETIADIKPAFSNVQMFALGITSEANNLRACALGISAEINGVRSLLQVIESTNKNWSTLFDVSFIKALPDVSRLMLPENIGKEISSSFLPSLPQASNDDWEVDFTYVEQVQKENDELRQLQLQYWRNKVGSQQQTTNSQSNEPKFKKLPKGILWSDKDNTFLLTFSSGEQLVFRDSQLPSAQYFKLLVNNYGLPIKHTDAMRILSCNKQSIKNLVKSLKEKIDRSDLNSRIIFSTQFTGAYTLEFKI